MPSTPTAAADIARAFAAQAGAKSRASAALRRDRLRRLQDALRAHFPEVMDALASDLAKPPFEAVLDAGIASQDIESALTNLDAWMAPAEVPPGETAAPGATAQLIYEPRGRVLIFGPWNFPFSLLFQPLVGALAAGNAAILKPSEFTPATSAVSARIVKGAFDECEVAIFEGGPEVASLLLEQPFEHIFFTGSTEVGRKVMSAASRHLSTLTLELGGKCPAVLDRGFDVETAARRIAWGKFWNAGQVCLAPDHAWVPSDQVERFADAVATYIEQSYYEAGRFNAKDLARIIHPRHVERLQGLVEDAVRRGARVVAGGDMCDGRMAPTLLCDVPPESAIMGEEIFGPVLPILAYDTTEDLLERISQGPSPLALYLFSDRQAFIDEALTRTSSGGVTINDVLQHAMVPGLPFGGVGESGMGAYHGAHSFIALSHARSVFRQAKVNPAEEFLRPPYGTRMPM